MTATAEDDAPPSDAFSVQLEEKVKDETALYSDTECSAPVVVATVHEESLVSRAPAPAVITFVIRV